MSVCYESISFHFYFWLFFKWCLFGFFLGEVRFLSFLAFLTVFAVGCVISFSWCWAPCCSFFRRAFCVRFCLCFLFFSNFFGFLFGSGCWVLCCFFFRRAFCVRFFFFYESGFFHFLIFGPFFVFFFFFFFCFFFIYFSVHFCFDLPQVSNFYESDSFIFDFLDHFLSFFFIFLFIFALTFHKCQIVMKAVLSFFDFWIIFCCFFIFLFIFALTFHKFKLLRKRFLHFYFLPFFF